MTDPATTSIQKNNTHLHEQKVYAEQVRLTYKPIKLSIIGTFLASVFFVAIQWDVISHSVLLSWLVAMTVLLSLHSFLAYRYFCANPDFNEAQRWGRYYVFSTLLAGFMWGTASILFFPESNFEQQMTVAFAMVIVCAGGVITLSHIRGASYALIFPSMLPLIPLFLLEDTYLTSMFALIMLVIFVFLLFSAYYFNASSQENISLRLTAIENEQSLILAKQEIEKASQVKSEFISSMSHELRTPMTVILGYAQVLECEKSLDEKTQKSAKEILRAGYHLLDLINEVLDLSKIESGHIQLDLEPITLSEIITECFSLIEPLAEKQGIKVKKNKIEQQHVYADRTRVKQVLINLLSNAIKYNKEEGEIGVEVIPVDDTYVRITVFDTGPGVAKERLDELFQPFNRLDVESKNIEGTGIGLTISRNLVEMMGGRIGVESELGKGSRFWFELPRNELLVLPEKNKTRDKE